MSRLLLILVAVAAALAGSIACWAWIDFSRNDSLIGDCSDPVVVRSHYVRYLTESYKEIATSFEQIESQQDIESSLSAIEIRCNQVCALLDACEVCHQ